MPKTVPPPSRGSARPRPTIQKLVVIATVAALITTSCGGGGNAGPAGQESVPVVDAPLEDDMVVEPLVDDLLEPGTAWEAALAGITDEGEVPLGVALQAFSLAMAPLPGVEIDSKLAAGTDHLSSGTGAVNWVLRHWDELTSDQKQVVGATLVDQTSLDIDTSARPATFITTFHFSGAARVGAPAPRAQPKADVMPAAAAAPPPKVGCWGQLLVDRDNAGAAVYRAELDELTGIMEARLGISMRIPVHLVVETKARVDAAAYTWSNPIDCQSNEAAQCTIHLNPGVEQDGPHEVRSILAHELFHCFQFQYLGMRASDLPPWIGEGMAAWVGEDLSGGSLLSTKWWGRYLTQPTKALFAREYDAIGFYAHLDETGADPWLSALTVMDAFEGSTAVDVALGTVAEQFLGSWPSGYARMPDLGTAWDTAMPGITADRPTIPSRTIGHGAVLELRTSAGANRIVSLRLTADVIDITTDGYVRITDADVDQVVLGGASYCIRPDGCACPGAGDGGSLAPSLRAEAMFALTGGTAAASASVKGRSISCHERDDDSKSSIADCLVGSWTSETFVEEGPLPELTREGGAGALVTITKNGQVRYNFEGFEPMVGFDPQLDATTASWSTGNATARIETSGGRITEHLYDDSGLSHGLRSSVGGSHIDLSLPAGPAVYVRLASNTSYTCAGQILTLTQPDLVDGGSIVVQLRRR